MTKINKTKLVIGCSLTSIVLLTLVAFSCAGATDKPASVSQFTPDVEEIRSICSLATTELDYNNVAKSKKTYWFFKKREKKLWIEHKGVVKVGIDVNKLEIVPEDDSWHITIPKAEILSVSCDPDSFNQASFTMSNSSLRKFSAYEQNKAMSEAVNNMKIDAESNNEILHDAQLKAKKIIENYFSQLNKKTNNEVHIKWDLQ